MSFSLPLAQRREVGRSSMTAPNSPAWLHSTRDLWRNYTALAASAHWGRTQGFRALLGQKPASASTREDSGVGKRQDITEMRERLLAPRADALGLRRTSLTARKKVGASRFWSQKFLPLSPHILDRIGTRTSDSTSDCPRENLTRQCRSIGSAQGREWGERPPRKPLPNRHAPDRMGSVIPGSG